MSEVLTEEDKRRQRIEKRQLKMNTLFQQIQELSDELPKELSKKLTLMASVLGLIGEYQADVKNELGSISTQRKYEFAKAKKEASGTVADKEAYAREKTLGLRQRESELEAELLRWELAYKSQEEKINTGKLYLRALIAEYNGKYNAD
ncbi:hypothetical protein [Brevibacillus migulae]|uniref:hypothetical protein n=1 Tax=Brevibacillus migulae TaxID=1644114 RepID=UPI00106E6B6F|nr:hypothetical protein [Brevibacillus migulae]